MKIIFDKIRFKNFLGFGANFTEIDLSTHAITGITGKNGNGKSTFIDVICFVLFNRPFRDVNKPDLVNSVNGKQCVGEVEFHKGADQYKIVRGIKPNIFEIHENGKKITEDSSKRDFQKYLEEQILRLNYKSFTQIVILGSRDYIPFMKLKTPERREIVENLLDIGVFATMNDILKGKVKINNNQIASAKSSIELVQEKIRLQEVYKAKLKEQTDDLIADEQNRSKEAESQVAELKIQLAAKTLILEECEQSLSNFQDAIQKLKDKQSDYQKIESDLKSNVTKISQELKFYEHTDTCPTCKQDITPEFKAETVSEKTQKRDEYTKALFALGHKIKALATKIETTSKASPQPTVDKHREDKRKIQTDLDFANRTILDANRKIVELQHKKNQTFTDETEALGKELEDKRKELESLETLAEYYKIGLLLLKDNGIKAKIVQKYVPAMNKLINQYLDILDLYVQFSFDENFNETIKSRHYDKFGYGSFSQGQKSRIDLSLLFNWRDVAKMKNSVNTNLLILDETFDSSLDAEGTESLMKILKGLAKDANIFVISHKPEIGEHFNRNIRFTTKGNFNTMEG